MITRPSPASASRSKSYVSDQSIAGVSTVTYEVPRASSIAAFNSPTNATNAAFDPAGSPSKSTLTPSPPPAATASARFATAFARAAGLASSACIAVLSKHVATSTTRTPAARAASTSGARSAVPQCRRSPSDPSDFTATPKYASVVNRSSRRVASPTLQ